MRARSLLLLIMIAVLLAGCGGEKKKAAAKPTPKPTAVPLRVITGAEARITKIGLTHAQVIAKFGKPPMKTPAKGRKLPCWIYKSEPNVAGNWQLCFKGDKLEIISSGGPVIPEPTPTE
jgi:hypothetical protein